MATALPLLPSKKGFMLPCRLTVAKLVMVIDAPVPTVVVPVLRVKTSAPPVVPPESTVNAVLFPHVMFVVTGGVLAVTALGSVTTLRLREPAPVPRIGSYSRIEEFLLALKI